MRRPVPSQPRQLLTSAAAMIERSRQDDGAARLLDVSPRIREMMARGQLSEDAARTIAWYVWCGQDADAYFPVGDPRRSDYHSAGNVWAPFLDTTSGRTRSLRLTARAYSAMIAGTATTPDGYAVPPVPLAASSLLLSTDPALLAVTAPAEPARVWFSWDDPAGGTSAADAAERRFTWIGCLVMFLALVVVPALVAGFLAWGASLTPGGH